MTKFHKDQSNQRYLSKDLKFLNKDPKFLNKGHKFLNNINKINKAKDLNKNLNNQVDPDNRLNKIKSK